MSEMVSFRAFPISERNLIPQGGPTCLTTFVTNSLTIRAKGMAMSVGTSTRWTSVLIPSGTTISSADFATQIAEEGIETHDACILARVETLMHGSNREDPGSRAAQRIGGLCALRMRDL